MSLSYNAEVLAFLQTNFFFISVNILKLLWIIYWLFFICNIFVMYSYIDIWDVPIYLIHSWRIKTSLISLAILFYFSCAQHISGINISIIRSLRLFYRITTLVILFLVQCVLEFWCGWVGVVSVLQLCFSLQHEYHSNPTTPKLQHTSNQDQYDQCGNSTE